MKKIFVTRPVFPPLERFNAYVAEIWENKQLTNHGPLHNKLEAELKAYLGVDHFLMTTNGTLALQMALRAFDLDQCDVITTPFSYVATVSSILWEHCNPVFADIDPETLCISPEAIERAITPKTKAIMAVHVFGYPCAVDRIEEIARKHNLKVIYDGAHAFGCRYKGRSLLDYGDIAISSFHATKVFHTIEGGCVIAHNDEISKKLYLLRSFGHIGDDHFELGFNAKASEFQAAMGLCNLETLAQNIERRKIVSKTYDQFLPMDKIVRPTVPQDLEYNYSYYPVVFQSKDACLKVRERLIEQEIIPRRYFFPSLNTLPYLKETQSCPISEDITQRILCLPLYAELELQDVERISALIKGMLKG